MRCIQDRSTGSTRLASGSRGLALAALTILTLLVGLRPPWAVAEPTVAPAPARPEALTLDRQLLAEAKNGSEIMANLTYLSDVIGPRLTGSANLGRANEWAAEKMKSYGLSNVAQEGWEMPVGWERGTASARILEPDNGRSLTVAAMGWTPGTNGKVVGDVVVINARNPEELKAYEGKLKNAIVLRGAPANVRPITDMDLFGGGRPGARPANPAASAGDKPPAPAQPGETAAPPNRNGGFDNRGFAEMMRFRREMADFLRKEGVAVMLSDAGKPHGLLDMTGSWGARDRANAADPLPTLFVAHEHYALLHRLATRPAPARTRLEVEITNKLIPGPLVVYNTLGEIRGSEKPDEIVVVGAHLDSWDLGQGTTDNGTGTCVVLETARLLAKSSVKPRRTIRFVLFTGEEQGLHGSKAYVQRHKDEMPRTSAALIHDTGTGRITGVMLQGRESVKPIMEAEVASLKDLGVADISLRSMGGSDHMSFEGAGVPGFMFRQDPAEYRLTHHSQSDTLDKAHETDLVQGVQVMSVLAMRVANRDELLPRDKKPEGAQQADGASGSGEAPRKIATVEGVTEYRLANGARVLLFPEASRPTVTVNMTVLTGSRHEGYGETGMAHLLEHMVFKGTPNHRDVPKALRDHGASFNGTTNVDRTNYFETMPATDENLEFGISLEADRLVNSFVKREDLVSEMTVVRNEFERGENSPQGILMQRIHAAAYEWHNYGKSTIGNRSDIERVPIENLQAFYKKYYQPDNVVLIVAGKFEEPKALALVQKYLGAIPKPARKLDDTYTEEPPQDGERNVILRRVGTVGSVGAAYHMPSAAHPDWAALNLLGGIISQQPNGRLYKALVESKKATGANAGAGNNHDPALFTASAQAEPGQLEAVRDTLLQTLEGLSAVPFTADEVDKAKVRNRRNHEMMQSNSTAMSQALSSASALGDWRLMFVQRDRIEAVTAEDVNRVAKTYFQKQNRTVGMYIPEEQPQRLAIAPAPALESIVKDYKGGTVAAAGEVFDPTPENLDARTKVMDLGNGIKAGLLPKKNRGETVSLVLTLHYGNEESLKGLTTAAGMLPGLMMAGTKKHDRQALREELDALGIRISPGFGGFGGGRGPRGGGGGGGGTAGQLTFSVEAKRSTLPAALKLLGEILREPAFPGAEFDNMKRRSLAGSAMGRTEPASLASNRLARALSPYSPSDVRYVPTAEESEKRLEAVTLDQVIGVYEKQVGATQGELAIVGDFDPEPTLAAVKEILKDWKSEVPVKRIDRVAPSNLTGSKEDILTPDKANAVFVAGLAFPMKETEPEFAALRLGNFLFGGSTLSSRLGNRIRQKEGLSYGVTSSVSASPRDPSASFTVNAITNPMNIDRVEKAFVEELTEFLANGPTPTELSDAQKAYLEAQKVGRTGDAAIAGQIASNLQLGRTFAHVRETETRIAALTPDEVKAAFRKYIDPKKLVIIRAGDFKK